VCASSWSVPITESDGSQWWSKLRLTLSAEDFTDAEARAAPNAWARAWSSTLPAT